MGQILWLASYPKSGNTWLRLFLHNLVEERSGRLDLNAIRRTGLMDAAREHYEAVAGRPHRALSLPEVAALRPAVQRALAAGREGIVPVKTHSMLTVIEGFPSHDPALTMGAIYLVRDPRDVAVSWADHMGVGLDEAIARMATANAITGTTAEGVTEFLGSWSQHVASWTGDEQERVLVLRFEDLLAAPRKGFSRVVAFLGLDVSSALVRKAAENTRFERLSAREAREGFSERSPHQKRFFRKGRAGAWRAILSPGQRAAIEAAHGEQMARFGYLTGEEG